MKDELKALLEPMHETGKVNVSDIDLELTVPFLLYFLEHIKPHPSNSGMLQVLSAIYEQLPSTEMETVKGMFVKTLEHGIYCYGADLQRIYNKYLEERQGGSNNE